MTKQDFPDNIAPTGPASAAQAPATQSFVMDSPEAWLRAIASIGGAPAAEVAAPAPRHDPGKAWRDLVAPVSTPIHVI